jgi:DNA-binding PucR family transcriptional regulator
MGRRGSRGDAPDLAKLARRAAADAKGTDPALLDGYLELLVAVCSDGRRVTPAEVDDRRAAGREAAQRGVPLGSLVDLHLSATWLAWPHLPRRAGAQSDALATTVLRAANDAIVALIVGHESAQRLSIRHEEAVRREFIDDLLNGTGTSARLLELAARFGLQLAGAHTVAVATATMPFADGDERTRRLEATLSSDLKAEQMLIATKEGNLVCVMPGPEQDATAQFASIMERTAQVERVGIGRAHNGAAGVSQSYREARDVLDVAERLRLNTPVLHAADLLVFQVLFRDRSAITDLVDTVLGPLREARGGPQPLLDTLAAYYEEGNAVAAARRLHLGVRTVTYRLRRVRDLTGYSATDPAQRFTLETAVQGARLLRWPEAAVDLA